MRFREAVSRDVNMNGLKRSLVARLLWEQNVAGSNPVSPTKIVGNKGVSDGLKNIFRFPIQSGTNTATQKNLVTFCDVHMVSSVWVFKRKWYGRSPIAEIEQDMHATWRD